MHAPATLTPVNPRTNSCTETFALARIAQDLLTDHSHNQDQTHQHAAATALHIAKVVSCENDPYGLYPDTRITVTQYPHLDAASDYLTDLESALPQGDTLGRWAVAVVQDRITHETQAHL